jgi:beta-RFAP synthase
MIRIRTPSRLHIGLLNVDSAEHWDNLLGERVIPERRFGGVGLMVQHPGVRVRVESAQSWSAQGPLAGRALDFASHYEESYPPGSIRPHHISVEQTADEHVGLGTGTQLAMAVARALAHSHGFASANAVELARRVGRGARSALGIHGFVKGGFLVEAGKYAADDISPLIARVDFPATWRILLVIPSHESGIHGVNEIDAFESLKHRPFHSATADALCRLVVLGILPALQERDFRTFSECLFDFNIRVGEFFSSVQGGRYGHPKTEALISYLRANGVRGVGQSSWGPTVFAVAESASDASERAEQLKQRLDLASNEVLITQACNTGASVQT